MRTPGTSLLIFAIIFAAILLSFPEARAAYLAPVPALVGVTVGSQSFSSPPGSFASQVNFTWMVSPSDPDQINGSLNYTFYEANGGQTPSGWTCMRGCLSSIGSHLPVPNRPGWLYMVVDTTGSLNGGLGPLPNGTTVFTFNVTANSGTSASAPSCQISMAQTINGAQDQCGSPIISQPTGVSALVTVPVNSQGSQGYQNISWMASPSDPGGNFTYRVWAQERNAQGVTFTAFNITSGTYLGSGLWTYNSSTTSADTFFVQVRAEDTWGTHQTSNWTCQVSFNAGHAVESNTCGTIALPFSGSNAISSQPVFPMLNVTGFANGIGLSVTFSGFILGAIVIVLVAGLGLYVANGPGAIFGATLGILGAGVFALWPFWMVLLIFTGGAFAVVLLWRGSQ